MSNITHLDVIRGHRLRKIERGQTLPRWSNPVEVAAYYRGRNARKTILASCLTAFAVVLALWVGPWPETPPAVKSAALEVGP